MVAEYWIENVNRESSSIDFREPRDGVYRSRGIDISPQCVEHDVLMGYRSEMTAE